MTVTVPRPSETMPSSAKWRSMRVTVSRTAPVSRAICSCVARTGARAWSDSSQRYCARRLSKLVNSSCCIAHMTSEKRSVARRYMQHSTWIFSAVSCWNTCAPRMSSSVGASATSCTSNVICRMTHAAASTQASPSVRR